MRRDRPRRLEGRGGEGRVFLRRIYEHTASPEDPTCESSHVALQAGLAAGVTLSAWPLAQPPAVGGRSGTAQARRHPAHTWVGSPHFDSHLTINNYTNYMLSFVYGRLVRHKTGADVQPGTFPIEPDLAERWEEPDDTTVVFHLRQGVKWHNKLPLNGREFVAEDVKFTYDRFLTEKANANRFLLEPVERVEVVDRYTVKFLLEEPFVWLVDTLAYPWSTGSWPRRWRSNTGTSRNPRPSLALDPSSWSAMSRTSRRSSSATRNTTARVNRTSMAWNG